MSTTATLQPAPPPAPPAEPPAPAPCKSATTTDSEPAPAPITTPDAFLQALIASNFDFPSLSRTIPAATLLPLIRAPQLRAALDDLTRFSSTCATLRNADLRQLSLDHLATIVANKSADPIESRRAASSILRASNSPREPRASLSSAQSLPPIPASTPAHSSAPLPPDPYPTTLPLTRPPDRPADRASGPWYPTPYAALLPTPFHTAAHVVDSLITQFARPREGNFGLRWLGYFLESSASLNGAPLLVGPHDESDTRELETSPLADCLGPPFAKVIEPPVELPGTTTAHTVIEFAPAGFPGPQHVSLTLTRSRTSRWPACWLVSSITVTPAPAATAPSTTTTASNDTS